MKRVRRKALAGQLSERWAQVHAGFTDQVAANLKKQISRRRPPFRLYHFTDCDGLIGIVKNRDIWATLATSLNDRSETQHGVVVAKEFIQQRDLTAKHLPLPRLDAALERQQSWRHYVISFCERSDTALHWLHYGRSGSGVALGFDTTGLTREGTKQGFHLYPVLYERDQQVRLLTSIVRAVDIALGRSLSRLRANLDRSLLIDVAVDLVANEFWRVAPRIKAPVFQPEMEWRLVRSIPMSPGGIPKSDPKAATSFRASSGRIFPYKTLHFETVLPAVEIVLGSSAQVRQDLLALQVLLEENVGTAIEVKDSPVPVRP